MPMPPVPVTVARAEIRPEPLSLNTIGIVEPIETVSIKAQVGGVINQVSFAEGQDVRAGQVLFQIDPRPFQVSLDAALAQLSRDQSQAANAATQAKRYADLVKKDYVTQEQFDSVRTQAEMFRSTVQRGRGRGGAGQAEPGVRHHQGPHLRAHGQPAGEKGQRGEGQ